GRPHQVADERVDGLDLARPRADCPGDAHPLADLAFLAHRLADVRELLAHRRIQFGEVVENLRNLALDAGEIERQPHREIALAQRAQRGEQRALIEDLTRVARPAWFGSLALITSLGYVRNVVHPASPQRAVAIPCSGASEPCPS